MTVNGYKLFVLFLFAISIVSNCQAENETITIGSPVSIERIKTHDSFYPLITRAYREEGLVLDIIQIPAKRSLVMSNNGTLDGEYLRYEITAKQYKNLVKIPVPVKTLKIYAYSLRADINVEEIHGTTRFTIGFLRGIEFLEKYFQKHDTLIVNTFKQLHKILINKRVDVVLVPGNKFHTKIPEIKIYRLEPKLFHQTAYHYLHKKHQLHIPNLTKRFKLLMNDKGSLK